MNFVNNNRFGLSSDTKGNIKLSIKDIVISNWILSGDEYAAQVTHNLDTDNLIISIYENNVNMLMNNVEIINASAIKIYNDKAINCKVVILAKE